MDQRLTPEQRTPTERVLYEVEKVIVGQDHLLERLVVTLLARGRILVEGVPGLAKTMAIKTVAEAIGGDFKRIQFTPDLVPADLVGTRIYNQKSGDFSTSLGPVFTNLLLAVEMNRAPAKVQSALLEAMQEHQEGVRHLVRFAPDGDLSLARSPATAGNYPPAGRARLRAFPALASFALAPIRDRGFVLQIKGANSADRCSHALPFLPGGLTSLSQSPPGPGA